MLNRKQIEKEIKEIICEITGIYEEKLEGDANFIEDLGIESIMAVDIISAIQGKYCLQIPKEQYGHFDCVDSAVDIVENLLLSRGN